LRAYHPEAVAVGQGAFAFAWRSGNDGVVELHAVDGAKVWERRWTANYSVAKLEIDNGGGVVFGGSFGEGGVDFGAGWYEPFWSSEVLLNGYITALGYNGALRFSKRLFAGSPDSLSANGYMIGYAVSRFTAGPPHIQLYSYDWEGREYHAGDLNVVDEALGYGINVLANSEGRMIVSAQLKTQPSAGEPGFSALLGLYP
jgi:hypothetical protein